MSCRRPSEVVKRVKGCDSLIITYYTNEENSIPKSLSTTNTKAIRKTAYLLDENDTQPQPVKPDGDMQFYKAGRLILPVVFSYRQPDKRFFLFDLDNKVIYIKMGNEAATFLKSLAEGKSWY
ncbi:MAG: hypothetical protein N2747_08825 [Chitinophagaceae bacterium]|nr:hypothetical protein [Chitinophagaceae bacterium]